MQEDLEEMSDLVGIPRMRGSFGLLEPFDFGFPRMPALSEMSERIPLRLDM